MEEFKKDVIAIVKSSVPEAVTWQELLKMDKTFALLGILVSVSSDNGPPFNSQDSVTSVSNWAFVMSERRH